MAATTVAAPGQGCTNRDRLRFEVVQARGARDRMSLGSKGFLNDMSDNPLRCADAWTCRPHSAARPLGRGGTRGSSVELKKRMQKGDL